MLDVARRLRGVEVWLDHLDLVPGRPWQPQLLSQVDEADAVLLFVSPDSMASEHVEAEWRRALTGGVRVVLAIVEPAPVPPELEDLEWIDLRWWFSRRIRQLSKRLSRGAEPSKERPPESGISAGLAVWRAVGLASVAAVASLLAVWTVIVPILLIPLPVRIVRRQFNFRAVRAALLALPILTMITISTLFPETRPGGTVSPGEPIGGGTSLADQAAAVALFVTTIGGWGTLWAITQPEVRRWLRPEAQARARPARWIPGRVRNPEPITTTSFRIDAAPNDDRSARMLTEAFLSAGHVEAAKRPAVVVHLVSNHHDTVEPATSLSTIPVLLTDPDDPLPPSLSANQWVDLRRGLTGPVCDAFARHLGQPDRLMASLGSPTPGGRMVRPAGVDTMMVALHIAAAAIAGRLLIELGYQLVFSPSRPVRPEFISSAITGGLSMLPVLALLRHLPSRGRLARRWVLAFAVTLTLFMAYVGELPIEGNSIERALLTIAAALRTIQALTGMALVGLWLWHRRAVRLWCPKS